MVGLLHRVPHDPLPVPDWHLDSLPPPLARNRAGPWRFLGDERTGFRKPIWIWVGGCWWSQKHPKTSGELNEVVQNEYENGPCQRWWRVDVASEAVRTAAAQLNNGCYCWNFTEPASAIRYATALFLHLPNWEEMTRSKIGHFVLSELWELLLDLLPEHLQGSNNLGMLRGTS